MEAAPHGLRMMTTATRNVRLVARLDVKIDQLIKGVQMEGWRKVGDPAEAAVKYAAWGADELLFMDVVASLYERNNLHEITEAVASRVFIPMTVGGGVRRLEDVRELLSRGADKVSMNTAVTRDPELITRVADTFGSQAAVVTIEAVRRGGRWEALTDNGRNQTGLDAVEWAAEVEKRGAGEIVLTSIDRDGTGRGYDIELVRAVTTRVCVPVVASGGLGCPEHLRSLMEETEASAAATAAALHWERTSLSDLRDTLAAQGCFVRPLDSPEAA